jgi:hypothetical protein
MCCFKLKVLLLIKKMLSQNNNEEYNENCIDKIYFRTSGNKEIDEFIQRRQLEIDKNSFNIIFEWIPYNQFNNIKEIVKDTIFLAKWNNGPLYRNNCNNGFIRKDNNINVTLKYLPNLQNVDEFLNKV